MLVSEGRGEGDDFNGGFACQDRRRAAAHAAARRVAASREKRRSSCRLGERKEKEKREWTGLTGLGLYIGWDRTAVIDS